MIVIALASMLMVADQAKSEKKVEVNGATYRVLVRGPEVVVAAKAFMTRRSPQSRDAMREAAAKATGCHISDDYWEGSRLVGKLACESTP